MRNLQLFLAVLFFVASPAAHANWGSNAGGSVATGSFHSFGTEQVEMQREDLRIRLFRDRAKVEIDYVLRNTGPAVDVRAGFPSLGVQLEGEKHEEIENYSITADGKSVAFTTEIGDPTPFKSLYDAKFREMGELDEYPPNQRPELLQWLASVVPFGAGESRHIHIHYESLYAYCGGGYSDDSDDCDDRFAYVLSTAAAWKGPIGEGHVSIEAVTVPAAELILTPAGRFRREGSAYVWDFRNLKPTQADDILVSLNNHSSTIADYRESFDSVPIINYYELKNGRYFYLSHDFVPSGASASPESSAAQVITEDNAGAWHSPHAPGIGDGLTLQITHPAHIDQVGVIPGCGTTEKAWLRHARIKRLEVTVNGDASATAVLPDEFTFPWPESDKAYEWVDLPAYQGNASNLRLTIRSVYPGSADQVTCIGKVMLREWLRSRPNIKSGIDGHELP